MCDGAALHSEWRELDIKKEIGEYRSATKRGETLVLRELRPYTPDAGYEWFAALRMDRESLTDPAARPRP